MPPVFVIGLSHKTAPVEVREKLAVSGDELEGKLQSLLGDDEIREAVILSTCNRVEVYFVPKNAGKGEDVVRDFFPKEVSSVLYVKRGVEAVSHLFRVTSGVDSLVVGEPQIAGQVKEAYSIAANLGATGPVMNKWLHKAFSVAKKVRTETGIGGQPVSVSSAAVYLAEKIFGDLEKKEALLVGAGEMGELAVQYIVDRGVKTVWIANRTLSKAEELATRFTGNALPFDQIGESLQKVDVVITSTASDKYVITSDQVSKVMKGRKNAPIFFVDIAVPRNVDPKVNDVTNAYLYNVDDLKTVVDESLASRKKEADQAEKIISDETAKFIEALKAWELSPTLQQLSFKFEAMRLRELDKAFKRAKGLTDTDKKIMDRCTESIVSKILHDPILLLKGEKEERRRYLDFIKKLFDLPE